MPATLKNILYTNGASIVMFNILQYIYTFRSECILYHDDGQISLYDML